MEIRRAIVVAFDSGSYTATVQIAGSMASWLSGVPVAKHLASGLLTVGARCGVIFFDPANPGDACVAFVYDGAPGAWVTPGMLDGEHNAGKHTNRTRSIWLPPRVFGATQGTPVLVEFGSGADEASEAWAFDAAADESVSTTFELPADWVPGTGLGVYYRWAAATATSGNVLWYITFTSIIDGESIDKAVAYNPSGTSAASGTARARVTSGNLGIPAAYLQAGGSNRIRVARLGSFAVDTMTGDALLLGVLIEYSADM